jgi:hypothetical protein
MLEEPAAELLIFFMGLLMENLKLCDRILRNVFIDINKMQNKRYLKW